VSTAFDFFCSHLSLTLLPRLAWCVPTVYAFFYSHLPLTLLVSALFTQMPPWDRLSGPAGDRILWAGVLLCLAAQQILVSTGHNTKRALSRAVAAALLVLLALVDQCFDLPAEAIAVATPPATPLAPPLAPPSAPPPHPSIWSLCEPKTSSFVMCVVLLCDVCVDAYLSFADAERHAEQASTAEGHGRESMREASTSCQSVEQAARTSERALTRSSEHAVALMREPG
jgi:hypothetical protein